MHHAEESLEPAITPMMNLMVVLIPLLLSTAEFVRLGFIEINLPPEASESGEQEAAYDPGNRLNLTVMVTNQGFYLASAFNVAGDRRGPTIPKQVRDGIPEYNYEALSDSLHVLKLKLEQRMADGSISGFTDPSQIVITAESGVLYETIVKTMAAARSRVVLENGRRRVEPLFPSISLSPPGIY
jgi:biopolymer transport protein ExbD